jgi:hypothetical protein
MKFHKLFLMTSLLLLLVACGGRASQSDQSQGYEIDFTAQNTAVGETTVTVTVRDPQGNPIDNAELTINGNMSHAGMQPVIVETSASDGGVYTTDFEWTMAGDWFVTITVTLPDGTVVSERFDGIQIEG